MPIIRVEMLKGRTVEQKSDLVKILTDDFVSTCGGKPEDLHVIISEIDKENWGADGKLISD